MRWHRLMRALVGVVFFVLGLGAAVFIFSNVNPVAIHWRVPASDGPLVDWTLPGVSLWLLAAVPLLIGGVLGYVYQTPARMHHFREHMRHLHRVHELEKELKELRGSLDKVLMMPEDGSLAVPAALLPPIEHRPEPKVAEVSVLDEPAAADLLSDFPDSEPEQHSVPAPAPGRRPAESRRKLIGGLKEEMTPVQLPAVPSTVAVRPRRSSKGGANGGARKARPGTKRTPQPKTSDPS